MRALANIRHSLALLLLALLQACGGGNNSGDTPSAGLGSLVSGVAATGLAIHGSVTLKDATGVTVNTVISQPSGTFSLDVAGLTRRSF